MKRAIKAVSAVARLIALVAAPLSAQKFYPDDPLEKEPSPLPVEAVNFRALNEMYDIFQNTFKKTSQSAETNAKISAIGVNTLGEVMDGAWYVNRHARKTMSPEELRRGPGSGNPPSRTQPWRVLTVKKYDIRPGLLIADARNNVYLLRFDPVGSPELSTGAAMIGSRLLHALGYWVPEHYIVRFKRSDLKAEPGGENINAVGRPRTLLEEDIDIFLDKVAAHKANQEYRAIAIRGPEGAKLIGPFQFSRRRSDDPNDIIPHEHRRELRGLHVISSWINNNWISGLQTMDALAQQDGVTAFRHYLIDFSTTLGSGFEREKQAREGNEPMFDMRLAARNFGSFGLMAPSWQRAHYPDLPAVGKFESQVFDPATWYPNYAVAALVNRRRDDDFWAAKKILAFSDDDIRVIVSTGEYSDPAAAEWIGKRLMERRDKVGRYYLERVLPLDNFRVEQGELRFDDLGVLRGLLPATNPDIEWSEFNNFTRHHTPILTARTFKVPKRVLAASQGSYYAAKMSGAEKGKTVTVYLRMTGQELKVAGIDRDWPGKTESQARPQSLRDVPSGYSELQPRQKELFDDYTRRYNEKAGFKATPENLFQGMSLSERTTFEAVTHALLKTELTGKNGKSLGVVLDLLSGVERIAGQYYGRGGDDQFRLYGLLKPGAREILEQSQQFHFGHENTVYHPGYPHSYRQSGEAPNIQFSISDDGLKVDIKVDYRSSKAPSALWSGHLTSANLDVREGDNYERHSNRWPGLVNWWQAAFGKMPEIRTESDELLGRKLLGVPTPLPPNRPPEAAIPEIHDAAQEFLTDWLVRRNGEAMAFVSDRALACVKTEDESPAAALTPEQARAQLRRNVQAVNKKLGSLENLTMAIEAVIPWRKGFRVLPHPFSKEFTVVAAPDAFAKAFNCQDRSDSALTKALDDPNPQFGNYYGVVLRLRGLIGQSGALGLLWAKENGQWRIISWKLYEP